MNMIDTIREEMDRQDLSMGELARRMKGNSGTRKKDLSEIFNRRREPGRLLLEEIAEGLGVSWTIKLGPHTFIDETLPYDQQGKSDQKELLKKYKDEGKDLNDLVRGNSE